MLSDIPVHELADFCMGRAPGLKQDGRRRHDRPESSSGAAGLAPATPLCAIDLRRLALIAPQGCDVVLTRRGGATYTLRAHGEDDALRWVRLDAASTISSRGGARRVVRD